jgi:predicted O-methyltransferase YrrM
MQHLYADIGSLPLAELTILGAISRYMNPRSVFEIGTYRGLSTLAIAMNTPDDTELFTLDLDKQNRNVTKYPMEMGGIEASSFPVGEYYHGSVHERKIQQLYGDSANFDFAPFTGGIDLIFIDGNHLYENVKSDSFNAFRMLRSKGVIIWDDYHAGYPGVMKCLDELAESKPLVRIAKTRLVVYRSDR